MSKKEWMFKGLLNEPIVLKPTHHIYWDLVGALEGTEHISINELVTLDYQKQHLDRMLALLDHYKIDKNDESCWFILSCKLAEIVVPALKKVNVKKKKINRIETTEAFCFYIEIRKIINDFNINEKNEKANILKAINIYLSNNKNYTDKDFIENELEKYLNDYYKIKPNKSMKNGHPLLIILFNLIRNDCEVKEYPIPNKIEDIDDVLIRYIKRNSITANF